MLLRILAPAVLCILATGCVSRPVLFNPAGMPAPPQATARVLIDRWGDLYPAVAVDTVELKRFARDSLSGYFEYLHENGRAEWDVLLQHYGVENSPDFLAAWQTVQDSIVANTIREATAVARGGPLIVLAHGFNNAEGEGREAYAAVREALQRRASGFDAGVLEVYWDGRTDLGHRPRTSDAWKRAQNNAYSAGLGLRRILNSVPHDTPLRILTHSHCGKIASTALWNVTSSLDDPRQVWRVWYDSLRNDSVRYATPTHPDVRLAMIVPAMPGNVIGDHGREEGSTPPGSRVPIDRLIIGQNRSDRTVSKYVFAATMGSTTLAVRAGEFENYEGTFNRQGQTPVAFCVDLSEGPPDPTKHAWTLYMQRAAVAELLDLLLLDDLAEQRFECGEDGSSR